MTVIRFIDVFTRRVYKDLLIESLQYCVAIKGLRIYGYVMMTNHLHMIIGKEDGADRFCNVIRDFKKYTSLQLVNTISNNALESRSGWMLRMMSYAGRKNSNNKHFQFWIQNNHPIDLRGDWIDQKLEYIHQNPVKAGFVLTPEEFYYSSARNYAGLENPMKVVSIYDGELI